MMVIVGGWHSLAWGPILGSVVLTLLSDTVLAEFPSLTMLLFGIILLVVILFLPGGLMKLIEGRLKARRGKGGSEGLPLQRE